MTLARLTALSQGLLAQAEGDGSESDDPFADFFGQPLIVVAGDDAEDTVPSWSTVDPLEYNRVRHWIRDNVLGGSYQGMESLVTGFVRAWGTRWYEEHNGQFPTLDQLAGDEGFIGGANWLPYSSSDIPRAFTTEGEDGVTYLATVDPMEGIKFTEWVEPEQGPIAAALRQGGLGSTPIIRDTNGSPRLAPPGTRTQGPRIDDRGIVSAAPGTPGGIPAQAGPQGDQETLDDLNRANPELRQAALADPTGGALEHIPMDDLNARLKPPSSGGGGGGGGGTRRDVAFDREMLLQNTRERWRSWFIEDANESETERIVDDYIREATGFWKRKGGQLDFSTFMENRLREQPRYGMIFRHKDPSTSEDEFLADFVGSIGQLGLSSRIEREQIAQSAMSGAGASAQLARVARSREARQTSGFTRQLAQTVANLGPGARV